MIEIDVLPENTITALAIVEEEPTPEPKPMPKFGDVYVLKEDHWENAPDAPNPYFIISKDGNYLHQHPLFGRNITEVSGDIPTLGKIDTTHSGSAKMGYMSKLDPEVFPIPKEICAQVYSFFARIYEKNKSEAAVILTINKETKQWRVFVPTQDVSHGGVSFVFEERFLAPGWLYQGTMHSHCNFTPFHSGTDRNDADIRNGPHFTIGFIARKNKDGTPDPGVANMISSQKIKWEGYKTEELADFSDLLCATAPEWWDEYVRMPSNPHPRNEKLFQLYPHTVIAEAAPKHSYPDSKMCDDCHRWHEVGGKHLPPLPPYNQNNRSKWQPPTNGQQRDYDNDYDWWGGKRLPPTKQPLALLPDGKSKTQTDDERIDKKLGNLEEDYWEEFIPKEILSAIFDTEAIGEDDIDGALKVPPELQIKYWQKVLLNKTSHMIDALHKLGIKLEVLPDTPDGRTDYRIIRLNDRKPHKPRIQRPRRGRVI